MRERKQSLGWLMAAAMVTFGISCATAPKTPAERAELATTAESTLDVMESRDPAVAKKIDESHAHAVFPKVSKAGAVAGGAYGRGIVFQGEEMIGFADVSQASVGAQLGGQQYSELILFRDEAALEKFQKGQFKPGAQASGVVVTAGGGAAVDYDKGGTAVVVMPRGGLMFDVSVNGQKFDYQEATDTE